MKVKSIPSEWIYEEGLRLDSGPYMSGALENKKLLENLEIKKQRLEDLTLNNKRGIFHAGRKSRKWVEDPKYGIPFLSSTDILAADLSTLPLISKKQIQTVPEFLIYQGWTLVTRSGTIGRTAFVREDMDGLACSEHVMRVIPDSERVPAGYLYAYLSSNFGLPLVISGTYGSIIQSIEPHHLFDLPVPRFSYQREKDIHDLVLKASELRVEASNLLNAAKGKALQAWDLQDKKVIATNKHPDLQKISSQKVSKTLRFDAFYYGQAAYESDHLLENLSSDLEVKLVGDIVSNVFETPRFGRNEVEDPEYGVPFLSISDLVKFDPKPDTLISKKQAKLMNATVSSGWLILPRVGQIHGVFGTVCYIPDHLDNVAVSDNNIRICPADKETGAYLWAALSTDLCYQQIIRRACGTSIPYLDSARVAEIPVPWPSLEVRKEIAKVVNNAMEKRSQACLIEAQAIEMVDQSIREAA
jgi:type I restriction enzyme S subunit